MQSPQSAHQSVSTLYLSNQLTFDLDFLHVWVMTAALLGLKVKVNPNTNPKGLTLTWLVGP